MDEGKSHSLAEELVDINAKYLLANTISGFGMKGRVIDLLGELKSALFPSLYEKRNGKCGSFLSRKGDG